MGTNSFIAPSTPLDRRHLGKYEVLCRLSTGGMSAIYLAHQTGLAGFKKLVVLKTILPDIDGEEDFVGMFLEEARITAVFNHPNIAQVFELETDQGQLFMAMEFVQGCTLVEMARACRQAKEAIPLGLTLAATRDTALALHYAHTFTDARGRKQVVIHRDVAEKNIMVTYEGVTKLLDFGIAKALGRSGRTSIGMVKGTAGYMSPEQIRGEPLDPRSDIFALGVVMHECLTGLRLFHGKTPEEGMRAALREEVQPPSKWNRDVGPELDAVVLKALQRDREKRFNTALEFAREIEKVAPGLIWHPEQLGEVVTRHFADRRVETRRLLESAEFGAELTGELRVENVLARVRAGAAHANSPVDPVRTPSSSPPSKAVTPRQASEVTRAGVVPGEFKSAPPSSHQGTLPGRPRALRANPNPNPTGVTAPSPVLARPIPKNEDVDVIDQAEAGDKTVPAAELPEEIRGLRSQFLANRKSSSDKAAAHAPSTTTVRDTESPPLLSGQAPAPAAKVASGPGQPLAPPTLTGETISITHKGSAMDWEDDEGAMTTIAQPNELPQLRPPRGGMRPPPSPVSFKPPLVAEPSLAAPPAESFDDLAAAPSPRATLIIALLVLAALAVGGLLVLLDVVPLPKFHESKKVGLVVKP